MATESVGILIEADDQASAKIKQAADAVDSSVKRIKEVGGKAKASTEFIGTLSNSLGGTALGGFAGQLAQLTERVSAFSEVSKAGGAGALAFKAGLVAAAGVVTYKIAESIASWYFEADRWRQAMADAAKEAKNAEAAFDRARSKQFSRDREDISLMADPMDRDRATKDRATQLEKQAKDLQDRIAESRASMAKQKTPEGLAEGQQEVDMLINIQTQLREEASSLRDSVSERTKRIAILKAENAAKEKSESYTRGLREEIYLLKATKEERIALTAAMNAVPEDLNEAESLLRERDALLAKAEAQKKAEAEAEQARAKELAAAERIADIQQREVERLEQRRIEISKGKEAAKAYALETQGIASEEAKKLAAKEAAMDKALADKEKAKQLGNAQTGTTAKEGRLLTRGPAEKGIDLIAKNTAKQVEMLAQVKTAIEKKPAGKQMQLEIVG